MRMQRIWIALGALAGLTGGGDGGLAAHGAGRLDPARLQMVRSGVQMQGWHALALVACGLWAARGGALANWAGAAFVAGLVVFCGAVYALALGGVRIAAAAPVGGTLLMLGWVLLGLSALRRW